MGLLVQSGIHIDNYEPHCDAVCTDPCTIDLQWATWMDAFAVVALATHIQENAQAERKIVLVAPEDDHVSAYLTKSGLADFAAEHDVEIRGHLKRPRRKRKGDRLVALQRVDGDAQQSSELAELTGERLVADDGDGGPAAEALKVTTEELVRNALRHGGGAGAPLLAAQAFAKTGDVVVAVGDTGVGIPASLRARHSVRDDGEALRKAVAKGVTATDDRPGGGLAQITDKVTELGGMVVLRSGTATLQLKGRRVRPPKKAMRHRGAVVGARIPRAGQR